MAPQPTDYDTIAPRYDRARSVPLEAIAGWRRAVAPPVPREPGATLLDLGAGTGIWAKAFIQWFGMRVLAVEPSSAMRVRASRARADELVSYIGGRAEQLPLEEDSCDCAWLSTVLHHVGDQHACAQELRRVVREGGAVLVRSAFADRMHGIPWLPYFPEAGRLAAARWPTVGHVVEMLERQGFRFERLEDVTERTAWDLESYARKVGHRADSTLAALSDEAFYAGMAALHETASTSTGTQPVFTTLQLLSFR